MLSKKWLTKIGLLTILALGMVGVSACSSQKGTAAAREAASSLPGHSGHRMADVSSMPEEIKNSAASVRESYSFAVGNPEILKRLPCYCGCGGMGHQSLYACYVESVEPAGNIQYDTHALGCSICVDIAQDGMRLTYEGKSVGEIKATVDETYSRYGTSNLP
jgi:hypothetical protein